MKLYKTKDYGEFTEIKGIIHSVSSYDFKNHLVMFDEVNAYAIKDNKIKVYENYYCISY